MVWDLGWWEPDLAWMAESKRVKKQGPTPSAEASGATSTAEAGGVGAAAEASGVGAAAEASGAVGTAGEASSFHPETALAHGDLKFILHGRKLTGSWALVQMKGRGEKNWLLLKHRDAAARPGSNITDEAPDSVATGRSLAEIAADGQGGATGTA